MALKNYPISKNNLFILNGSGASISGTIYYRDSEFEDVIFPDGVCLEFEQVESLSCQEADYANLTISPINRVKGFFLK